MSLDFDPGVNGKTGQVICNVEKNKVVNHNFDDFLAWYVERLQTGKYYIGEPDGIYDEPAIEFRVKRGTHFISCLLYTSPSPRDQRGSRMPSSA